MKNPKRQMTTKGTPTPETTVKAAKKNNALFNGGSSKRKLPQYLRWMIALCAVLFVAATVTVYAWFTGAFETPGAVVKTGKINLGFRSYKLLDADEEEGIDAFRRYIDVTSENPGSINLLDAVQTDIGIYADSESVDETYFVLERMPDSIPLDIRFVFSLLGVTENLAEDPEEEIPEDPAEAQIYTIRKNAVYAFAGGFVYRFEEITPKVTPYLNNMDLSSLSYYTETGWKNTSAVTSPERALYAFIQNGEENGGTRRDLICLDDNNDENESNTLRTEDYSFFRLSIYLKDECSGNPLYANQTMNVKLNLQAAQIDGFLSHGSAQTHYVNTDAQLMHTLDIYSPGDSIVIGADITYNGDLVFPKPVNLYLNYNGGKCLTVKGNLVFSYPYEDTYLVDTSNNGQIKVLSVGLAGGNFRIDVPNGNVVLRGEGNTAIGKADYYVMNDILWNASCIPHADYENNDSGYGITLDHVWMLQGTGASDENQIKHPIYIANETQLTVNADTTIGQIKPITAAGVDAADVRRIVIVNYGTIDEEINLSSVVIDTSGSYNAEFVSPQIYIDNYNNISKEIVLPAHALQYFPATNTGNTRIIQEVSAKDTFVAQGSGFTTLNVEKVNVIERVVDFDHDGTNLGIYYTIMPADNGTVPTIQSILDQHIADHGIDANHNTTSKTQIKKLQIITLGDCKLTSADYTYIKKLTGLEEIDLSAADTDGGSVPAEAFKGLSDLWNLALPGNTVSLGNNVVQNTQVVDLVLPSGCKTLTSSSLTGVKAVHVNYTGGVITTGLTGSKYVFLPNTQMLTNYRNSSSFSKQYLFLEATYTHGSELYYRFVSSTDAEFACYIGSPISSGITAEIASPDFGFDKVNYLGEDYRIISIDDYAFYDKFPAIDGFAGIPATVSDAIRSIGQYAFYGCSGVMGPLNIPTATTSIGTYAYYNTGISSLYLEGNPTLGTYAFYGAKLETAEGPELKKLSTYCFGSCKKLLKAVFPKATLPSSSGAYTFRYCSQLVALETCVDGGDSRYNVQDCAQFKLWIIHTENITIENTNANFFYYVGSNLSADYAVLVSESTQNAVNKNHCSSFRIADYTDTHYDHLCSSGQFLPEEYRYADDPNAAFHATYVDNDGVSQPLSKLGYGDYCYGIDADGNATLIHCFSDAIEGEYSIPASFKNDEGVDCPVVELAKKSYRLVPMTAVNLTFPDSLVTLGNASFQARDIVTDLDLNKVETVRTYCFYGVPVTTFRAPCLDTLEISNFDSSRKTLTEVLIRANKSVAANEFQNCTALTDVTITGSGTLGSYCFDGCTALTNLVTPELRALPTACFRKCTSLFVARAPKASMTTSTFEGCTHLTVVESAYYSGGNGQKNFEGCMNLLLLIVHTENALSASNTSATFAWTNGYASSKAMVNNDIVIVMSENTDNAYGVNAFSKAYVSYTSADYQAITSGGSVFTADQYRYASFPDTELPENVVRRTYTGLDEQQHTLSELGYGDYIYAVDANGNATLITCLLKEITGDYATPASFSYTEEGAAKTAGVVEIGTQSYYHTDIDADNFVISEGVKKIGSRAFFVSTSKFHTHESAAGSIPSTVESIGSYAFQGANMITHAGTLPNLKTIGTYAFQGATTLIDEIKADSLTSIGENAFQGGKGVKEFSSASLTSLGTQAFNTCSGIERFYAPLLPSIPNSGCFQGCASLLVAYVPNASLGKNTFRDCPHLAVVETNYYVPAYDNYSFENDMNLQLWVMHTENATTEAVSSYNTAFRLASQGYASSTTKINSNFVFVISESTANSFNKDYYAMISEGDFTTGTSHKPITNGGQFNANEYKYASFPADETDANVVRRTYTGLDEQQHPLSELGYGDYIYAVDADGNATLITCLLAKVQGEYATPASFTYEEGGETKNAGVVEINKMAYYHTDIDSDNFVISEGVKKIGDRAFFVASSKFFTHKSAAGSLPSTVEYIGEYAFLRASMITHAGTLPNLKTIGQYAFNDVTTVIDKIEADSLTSIGDYAFQNSGGVREFSGASLTKLGTQAFISCTGIERFYAPELLTIPSSCFKGDTSLLLVCTPKAELSTSAFDGCTHLVVVESTIGTGTYSMYTHENCTNFRLWIVHTENAKSKSPYGSAIFYTVGTNGCASAATKIGDHVVVISESDDNDFGTDYFKMIYGSYYATASYKFITNGGAFTADQYRYASFPDSELPENTVRRTYTGLDGNQHPLSDLGYGDYIYAIDENGKAVLITCLLSEIKGDYATPASFSYEESGETKTATVTEINKMAYFHTKIASDNFVISEGVKKIGDRAFVVSTANFYTHKSTAGSLPSTVEYIGEYAFQNASMITHAEEGLPNLKTIGQYAFQGVTTVIDKIEADSLTTVGDYAFQNGGGVKEFSGASLTKLGTQAFNTCSGIERFSAPELLSVPKSGFSSCKSLLSAYVPKADLQQYAFKDCSHLAVVESAFYYLGNGDTDNYQFDFCTNLQLWVVHTENATRRDGTGCSNYGIYSYYMALSGYGYAAKTANINQDLVVVISESTNNAFGSNYYSQVYFDDYTSTGRKPITSGGQFNANEYLYASFPVDETDANVVRRTYLGNDGNQHPLSDLGYGDYIYAIDENGKAVLITCLLSEIKGNYATPASFSYEEGGVTKNAGVTEIGKLAYYHTKIASDNFVISEGVKKIGDRAFFVSTSKFYTHASTAGSLPSTVEYIGEYAFQNASMITHAGTLPNLSTIGQYAFDGVTTTIDKIEANALTALPTSAFSKAGGVKEFSSTGLTSISGSFFAGSTKLESFSAPNLLSIPANAFQNCTALVEIELAPGVTLGNTCFNGCTSLKNLTLSGNATLGNNCFQGCTSLKDLTLSGNATLGNNCFQDCTSLERFYAPELLSLPRSCFYGCYSLLVACAPKATLGAKAFDGCSKLAVVECAYYYSGDNVSARFNGCSNLRLLVIHTESAQNVNVWKNEYLYSNNAFGTNINKDVMIVISESKNNQFGMDYYVAISGENYTSSEYKPFTYGGTVTADQYKYGFFDTELPANVVRRTYLGNDGNQHPLSDLGYGDYIYAVDANGNATIIACLLAEIKGNYATPASFSYKEGGVTKTANVTEIGKLAYYHTKIASDNFVVSEGVKKIGDRAFFVSTSNFYTHASTAGSIPSTVEDIGEYAFQNASMITHAGTLPNLSTIGQYTFGGVTTTIDKIEANALTTLPASVFSKAGGVKEFSSTGLTSISGSSFAGSTKLESFSAPNLLSIPASSFKGCTALTTVELAPGVTLGSECFSGCTALERFDDPELLSIPSSCFKDCTSLRTVYAPKANLASSAFEGCTKLAVVECAYFYSPTVTCSFFNNCTNLQLVIIHTENAQTGSVQSGNYTFTDSNFKNVDPNVIVVISESTNNQFAKDYYSVIATDFTSLNYKHITSGGMFTADQYRYGSFLDTELPANVVRRTYLGNDGNQHPLSELGYGDYIYAVDANGNATIIACLLKEIKGTYNTPASFTYEEGGATKTANVTEIGKLAYYHTKIASDNFVISEGVKKIGDRAFFVSTAKFYTHASTAGSIPSTVEYIGEYAFQNASMITHAGTLPNLKTIGQYAFDGTTTTIDKIEANALQSLPTKALSKNSVREFSSTGLTSLTSALFTGSTTLERFSAPNLLSIPANAFQNCTALVEIELAPGVTLGSNCFNGCTSLKDLTLSGNATLGGNCFQGCTSLERVYAPEVTALSTSCFQDCSSLLVCYTPKASWKDNCFKNCTHLAVIETALFYQTGYSSNGILTGCTNLKLWILHPENAAVSSQSNLTYNLSSNDPYKLWANNMTHPDDFVMLVSESTDNPFYVNYVPLIKPDLNSSNYYYSTPTGEFLPGDYLYADATELPANVTRRTYTGLDGEQHYLSELGYGDYVFGINEDGTATLITCLLREIKGNYQTPASFTYEEDGETKTANVTVIGEYAYSQTSFPNASTVTFSEGVKTVGTRAFYRNESTLYKRAATVIELPKTIATLEDLAFGTMSSVKSVLIHRDDATVTATNLFSNANKYTPPTGFTVQVPAVIYASYTASDRWGNLPKSVFGRLDASYQPVAGGPIFYLTEREDGGYRLTSISDVTDSVTTLTIPDEYIKDGVSQGIICEITKDALQSLTANTTIKTIVLPSGLSVLSADKILLPKGLETLSIASTNAFFETDDGVLYDKGKTALLLYPSAKTVTTFDLPSTVVAIGKNAFNGVTALTTITGTAEGTFDGYLFVAENAFVNCTKLANVTFGRSVVLAASFSGCTQLANVTYLGTQPTLKLTQDPFGGAAVTEG